MDNKDSAYDLLKYFAEKAQINIENGYNNLVISDIKYSELAKQTNQEEAKEFNVLGLKIIKKSQADTFMDLSHHWIDDDSIFLFSDEALNNINRFKQQKLNSK